MLDPQDCSAYLDRIGYAGPVSATRDALAALQSAHVRTIPFETLDPLTGRAPDLDLPGLVRKLVRSRRGGYCYEHNLLFRAVLENFGFEPSGLLGRVLFGGPEDAQTARTHMLLRLPCEGEDLIVDVGFGGQVPTGPLRLVPGLAQETPHEPCRLEEARGVWGLRAKVGEAWRLLYRFTLEPAFEIDYAVGNHFVATHRTSPFAGALIAARILPRGRLTLLGRRLTEHRLGEASRSETLPDEAALRRVLDARFGIAVDDGTWARVTVRMVQPA